MKTHTAYCARCQRVVRLLVTDAPLHGGQATLPDAPELVCLDCSSVCADEICPLTNLAHVVMEQRIVQLEEQSDFPTP